MLSLIIPWVLTLLCLITVILLIRKKWKFSIFIIIIIALVNWQSDCFCFGFENDFKGELKVLSFNVNGGTTYDINKLEGILSLVAEEKPDILFLAENFGAMGDTLFLRLRTAFNNTMGMGAQNVIYSKYPLSNSLNFQMINGGTSYMMKCDADVKGKTVTLFGCHLSSNNYSKSNDYLTPDEVETVSGIKAYFENISHATQLREMEADTVIYHCSNVKRVAIMGDLNEVSGASSMRKFKDAGYKDAWSEGGFGYGATIHHPLPYRIDHVLYNSGLKLKGIKKIDARGISDHDALVAVFDLE